MPFVQLVARGQIREHPPASAETVQAMVMSRDFRLELVDVELDGGVTVRRLLLIDERRGVCVDVPDPAAAMIEAMIEEADTDE